MAGISLGPSHSRPCSGEKTIRRWRCNEVADEITPIDVDSENFDNVIIIDIPDSLPPKKNKGSSMLRKDKWPSINVINIDDDETPENTHFAGTSSNGESIRVDQNYEDSVEDCQFVQDKSTPFRLSPLDGSVARDSGGGGGGGSGTGVLSIEDEIRPHKKIGCKIDQIG